MNKTIPAPSGLQKQLNSVGSAIQKLNVEDIITQRNKLKNTLQHSGFAPDTPIPAKCDRQYNLNLRYSRRRTPFAPATQTRDVFAENLTPEKKVIGFNYENKLCKKGKLSRARGLSVNCPGHESCTATLKYSDNVGDEQQGGRKLEKMVTESKFALTK